MQVIEKLRERVVVRKLRPVTLNGLSHDVPVGTGVDLRGDHPWFLGGDLRVMPSTVIAESPNMEVYKPTIARVSAR
jgi:hypothetical protein